MLQKFAIEAESGVVDQQIRRDPGLIQALLQFLSGAVFGQINGFYLDLDCVGGCEFFG